MNFRVNLTMSNGAASSSNVVDGNTVFAAIAEWAAGFGNVSFIVHTLTPTKVEVSYEYNMAHMFGLKTAQGAPSYGWLYTITPYVNDPQEDLDLTVLYFTLRALCLAYPDICSSEVATELGVEIETERILALITPR